MPHPAGPSSALAQLLAELGDDLRTLQDAGLRRQLRVLEAIDGPLVRVGGRELVCWCSNDYLGLAQHPALIAAAGEAAGRWGIGARSARLLAGTTRCHADLEERLARWFNAEAAIVFASGYLANLGALRALASRQDVIVADRLCHASLLDAARASGATFRVFEHNNATHAAEVLERLGGARRLLVTEGVFSMDGDRAPLAELAAVAQAQRALLYLDDAHGAFAMGAAGRGAPEAAGVPHANLLYMGTLGKALGTQGGFLIGPRVLVDALRHRARTWLYATALAVPVAAAAHAALGLEAELRERREQLRANCQRLFGHVQGLAGAALREPSHIVPIVVGSATEAQVVAQRLEAAGHWAPAIRPPTVPEGSSRLRLGLTALHTSAQIDALAEALRETLASSESPVPEHPHTSQDTSIFRTPNNEQ